MDPFSPEDVREERQRISIPRLTLKNIQELARILQDMGGSGFLPYLVCKKLPHDLGYGIFLDPQAEPIRKGQAIGMYAGELSFMAQNDAQELPYGFTPICDILLSKEEQALFDGKRPYRPSRVFLELGRPKSW
jgi:hypothetical protein